MDSYSRTSPPLFRIHLIPVDGLKHTTRTNNKFRGKTIGFLAREAMRWAQEALHLNDGSVTGQTASETVDEYAVADNSILACCMYRPNERSLTSGILRQIIPHALRC